jgi:glycosyltransferase involved in cell wall biosynthesis
MRICYVADGASIHTQRWVNYFAGKGHEVHLVCWKLMPGYDESIRVHRLTRLAPAIWPVSQYISFLFWVLQVRRLVHRIKPDIVDGHFITVYGFLAACSGFHPLVVTAWGSDILVQPKGNPLSRFTAGYAVRKADTIVCLFPIEAAKEYMSELGVDSSKLRTVLLGVDTTEFSPSHRDEEVRRNLGAESSQPVVISTRALAPIYNVETLVKAIPLVLAEIPQAQFVIAGAGQQQDALRQLARSLGVSNNTAFVGWVPRGELPKYLASADIYVSSSLSDGASVSLLEAMASELAPVVSDIPANRSWVNDGENGFLFPTRDSKTLASKIIHLLNDREVRADFSRKSREIVRQNAEEETEMGKLESTYHELVEAGPSGRRQLESGP